VAGALEERPGHGGARLPRRFSMAVRPSLPGRLR
jgi:hypothetical protein